MQSQRDTFRLSRWFPPFLGAVAVAWGVLALVCWNFPAALLRVLLVLFTGGFLLAGFAWYGAARWAWRRGQSGPEHCLRPAALLLFAWLLCLGSALASAFPRQVGRPASTPTGLFTTGPCRFLSDLPEFDVQTGPIPFGKKGNLGDGKQIEVGGVPSPHGLGMCPPWAPGYAAAKYRLGKEAAVFRARVAINDTTNWCWSPATFTVLGDGKPLWQSKPISHNTQRADECDVDVSGVEVLELRVQCLNGSDGVHAVWVEPRVLHKADTPDH
jgi:hypothetical protein